jgi:hypothetical protein
MLVYFCFRKKAADVKGLGPVTDGREKPLRDKGRGVIVNLILNRRT